MLLHCQLLARGVSRLRRLIGLSPLHRRRPILCPNCCSHYFSHLAECCWCWTGTRLTPLGSALGCARLASPPSLAPLAADRRRRPRPRKFYPLLSCLTQSHCCSHRPFFRIVFRLIDQFWSEDEKLPHRQLDAIHANHPNRITHLVLLHLAQRLVMCLALARLHSAVRHVWWWSWRTWDGVWPWIRRTFWRVHQCKTLIRFVAGQCHFIYRTRHWFARLYHWWSMMRHCLFFEPAQTIGGPPWWAQVWDGKQFARAAIACHQPSLVWSRCGHVFSCTWPCRNIQRCQAW